MLNYYQLDSIGWGTPFLLVPEATSVDEQTLEVLCKAKEDDLYLSEISPLGVLFNNVRGNSMDIKKETQNNGVCSDDDLLALCNSESVKHDNSNCNKPNAVSDEDLLQLCEDHSIKRKHSEFHSEVVTDLDLMKLLQN